MSDFSLHHRVRPAREGTAPYPCLLLLHGLGSNEEDLFSLAPLLDPRLVVVSARAPLPRGDGFAWYDIEREGPGLNGTTIERSLDLLGGFLLEIVEQYEIDPEQLVVGGFSLGAAMAGALLLLEPDSVAGAIMISGFLPPDPSGDRYKTDAVKGKPVYQAHGTQDPTVPLQFARMTRDFLQRTSVDLTYREYPVGHWVNQDELADLKDWFGRLLEAKSAPAM
jgi:phospholipase/carboxylesterase